MTWLSLAINETIKDMALGAAHLNQCRSHSGSDSVVTLTDRCIISLFSHLHSSFPKLSSTGQFLSPVDVKHHAELHSPIPKLSSTGQFLSMDVTVKHHAELHSSFPKLSSTGQFLSVVDVKHHTETRRDGGKKLNCLLV